MPELYKWRTNSWHPTTIPILALILTLCRPNSYIIKFNWNSLKSLVSGGPIKLVSFFFLLKQQHYALHYNLVQPILDCKWLSLYKRQCIDCLLKEKKKKESPIFQKLLGAELSSATEIKASYTSYISLYIKLINLLSLYSHINISFIFFSQKGLHTEHMFAKINISSYSVPTMIKNNTKFSQKNQG